MLQVKNRNQFKILNSNKNLSQSSHGDISKVVTNKNFICQEFMHVLKLTIIFFISKYLKMQKRIIHKSYFRKDKTWQMKIKDI